MIYHIVVGDEAAKQMLEAISMEPSMEGGVIILKDILHVGPLQKGEGRSFSEMRTEFWKKVLADEKQEVQVDDLERLLLAANNLSKSESAVIWLWMAPWPADVCAYYWSLKYLGKYIGRLYILNLSGLPFLDEEGKVYYPRNISEVLPKELVKARKLARPVTPAELEVDGEEWLNIMVENAGHRILEGGKKLIGKDETYYDEVLLSYCSHQYQKAQRIVNQAMSKTNIPTGDVYLGWRLRTLVESGRLRSEGDMSKGLRDYSIKLPGGNTTGEQGVQEDTLSQNEIS